MKAKDVFTMEDIYEIVSQTWWFVMILYELERSFQLLQA